MVIEYPTNVSGAGLIMINKTPDSSRDECERRRWRRDKGERGRGGSRALFFSLYQSNRDGRANERASEKERKEEKEEGREEEKRLSGAGPAKSASQREWT